MYYTIIYKKDKNCPIFIDGVLHESFFSGAYDTPMTQKWYDAGPNDNLDILPTELNLVTEDKAYEFDFCRAFSGFIISSRFLLALDNVSMSAWEISKLNIVDPNGNVVVEKSFFFIRQRPSQQETTSIIDFSSSKIVFSPSGEIQSIDEIVLTDSETAEIFCINESSLFGHIFITESLFEHLFPLNFKGIQFMPLG